MHAGYPSRAGIGGLREPHQQAVCIEGADVGPVGTAHLEQDPVPLPIAAVLVVPATEEDDLAGAPGCAKQGGRHTGRLARARRSDQHGRPVPLQRSQHLGHDGMDRKAGIALHHMPRIAAREPACKAIFYKQTGNCCVNLPETGNFRGRAMESRNLALIVTVAALSLAGCSSNFPFGNKNNASASPSSTAQPLVGTPVGSSSSAAPAAVVTPASGGPSFSFGDDASRYSRDGECDDKRFSGPGMTSTPLLDSDVGHDATDCHSAYNQNRLTYVGESGGGQAVAHGSDDLTRIQWGDDGSKYSRDGECDDKRFIGPGMTNTPLLDSDIQHDATDCRAAYAQGRLSLRE